MHKGKTLRGSFGRDTFACNHLKPAVFARGLITRMHVAPIEAHGERAVGPREIGPLPRTAVNEKHLLIAQLGFGPFRDSMEAIAHGLGIDVLPDRQYLV